MSLRNSHGEWYINTVSMRSNAHSMRTCADVCKAGAYHNFHHSDEQEILQAWKVGLVGMTLVLTWPCWRSERLQQMGTVEEVKGCGYALEAAVAAAWHAEELQEHTAADMAPAEGVGHQDGKTSELLQLLRLQLSTLASKARLR